MRLRISQEAALRDHIRKGGLDPRDFNLEALQARAEELYAEGCSPIESYSRAIGVDLTPEGYEGPTMGSGLRRVAEGRARAFG